MGLPEISIIFKGKAETMLKRSERGIVALILEDTKTEIKDIASIKDIPESLSEANKEYVKLALKGNDTVPRKVIIGTYASEELEQLLDLLETVKFQYLAIPGGSQEDHTLLEIWTKELVDEKDFTFQSILANVKGDHEAIINFTTSNIKAEDKEYTASEYTSRIAGLLAGTPLTKSVTYSVLEDLVEVERISNTEANSRIDNGEFILVNDGDQVRVARGVTSLTTLGENKNSQWKKILIVQKMFMWKDDVKNVVKENYVGNFSNTYDNKCLLITDIRLYNKELEKQGILDSSDIAYNNVFVDIQAQKDYLEKIGEFGEGMGEDEIKKANTREKVFIGTNLKYTDAMEDFHINASV